MIYHVLFTWRPNLPTPTNSMENLHLSYTEVALMDMTRFKETVSPMERALRLALLQLREMSGPLRDRASQLEIKVWRDNDRDMPPLR